MLTQEQIEDWQQSEEYYTTKGVNSLDFDTYQTKAVETAIYPSTAQVVYPAMGLANEAGEVLGKVKKIIRDGTYNREDIAAELGDVLWYAAALARDLNVDLSTIAQMNLDKLSDRKARGKLQGSGDKR